MVSCQWSVGLVDEESVNRSAVIRNSSFVIISMFILTAVLLAISTLQWISGILVLIFLFLGFKILESNWSYRISKPHAWESAASSIPRNLKKIERFYRDKVRFYNFWFQIERLKKDHIAGAFAEVGVYKGETAKMIHLMDPTRKFYLFDTFDGFAKKDLALENQEDENLKTIDFSDTTEAAVTGFIGGNENIKVIPGYFPETTAKIPEESFAFVHLDADLYQPTLTGLRYFYPKLAKGGVIIVHDYNHNWEGVRKAVDEFRETIPERIVEVADWQGSVMIFKNDELRMTNYE